eukprot:gene14093-biopygen17078
MQSQGKRVAQSSKCRNSSFPWEGLHMSRGPVGCQMGPAVAVTDIQGWPCRGSDRYAGALWDGWPCRGSDRYPDASGGCQKGSAVAVTDIQGLPDDVGWGAAVSSHTLRARPTVSGTYSWGPNPRHIGVARRLQACGLRGRIAGGPTPDI